MSIPRDESMMMIVPAGRIKHHMVHIYESDTHLEGVCVCVCTQRVYVLAAIIFTCEIVYSIYSTYINKCGTTAFS